MEQAELKTWTTERLETELHALQTSECVGRFDLILEDWIAEELDRRDNEEDEEM